MSEPPDDILTRPLGLAPQGAETEAASETTTGTSNGPTRRLAALRPSARAVALACAGGFALLVGGLVLLGDPQGGEPRAGAVIEIREADPAAPVRVPVETAAVVSAPALPVPAATPRTSALHSSASEIERASGVIVTRPAGSAATEQAVIVRVPSPDPVRLAPAPDPRLTERGRHGGLPRMGEGGVRALDVYARPDDSKSGGRNDGTGGARIALLVSGVGIGQAATAAAIARLPPPISLALSPYAADPEKIAARARDAGHEILVQAPMEPFDYPDSDPGPQTLLAASRPVENLDRLAWAISRFPGIVGVVNFMGGRLLGEAGVLEPMLRDIAARGLGFVDDGASQGSQAVALARKSGTPAARAEIVLDGVARPEAIDAELARAEAKARGTGFVLVSASAQQLSIDRIARWARDLDARGVRLVPVSTALRATPAGMRLSEAEH